MSIIPNSIQISHWLLSATLFGPRDKIIEDNSTAWCLAKIFRLVGNIESPENPEFKDDFDLARALEGGGYIHPKTGEPKPYISVGTLREELSKHPREICSETCIDFLEHLLVIDPAKRPRAEMALRHPFVNSVMI
jgi:serine/threonine protein kinase